MKILLTAHGSLASSMLESIEMILGPVGEQVNAINFDKNETLDSLSKRIENELDTTLTYIFCDLKGGTPFNASYLLSNTYPIKLICGMNLGMMLESIMKLLQDEESFNLEIAKTVGNVSIEVFDLTMSKGVN